MFKVELSYLLYFKGLANIPLIAAASVSHGAGTDGTSLMAEMIWVASVEASGCETNTEEYSQFGKLHVIKNVTTRTTKIPKNVAWLQNKQFSIQ